MSNPIVDLPSPVTYGTVICNVARLLGDVTGTPVPDLALLNGKCRISTPGYRTLTILGTTNYIIASKPIEWPIVAGKLKATPTAVSEGVRLIASASPGKVPTNLQYYAEFFLEGMLKEQQPHPIYFEVIASQTTDLATIIPANPAPPVIVVNSYQDRAAVEVALASIQGAKLDAQNAASASAASAVQAQNSAAEAHAAIIILQGANTPVPPGTPPGTVVVHVA